MSENSKYVWHAVIFVIVPTQPLTMSFTPEAELSSLRLAFDLVAVWIGLAAGFGEVLPRNRVPGHTGDIDAALAEVTVAVDLPMALGGVLHTHWVRVGFDSQNNV